MKAGTFAAVMAFALSLATGCLPTKENNMAWDKTFPKSDKVDHQKVSYRNRT